MSDLVNVTFIGGEADLTRKVMDDRLLGSFIDVPVLPKSPPRYNTALYPEHAVCRMETYRVHRLSRSHAIAVLEYL